MTRLKIILQSKIACYFLLIISIILSLFIISKPHNSKYLNSTSISGKLTYFKLKDNSVTMDIKADETIRVVYYFDDITKENFNFSLGDTLLVHGKVKEIKNNTIPNTFNYKKYLSSKRIYCLFNASNIEIVRKNTNILYKIKNNINNYIKTFKSKDYLSMFITGDKSYMDEDSIESFTLAGVSHIFAISGMHVSILTCIILKLLKKYKDTIKYIIVIVFLLFYIFLTNFSSSILRASTVFIFLFINKKANLFLDTINVFLLSIAFLLFINPHIILDIGFLYSVTTSYFLINFNYLIKGNYLEKLLKTSSIAFLVSLPITVSISYNINILSVLNNLLIVPLISLFVYPLSLLTFIFKFLDIPFYYITRIVNLLSNKLLVYNVVIPKMNLFIIIIYYVLIILFFISYKKKIIILLLTTMVLFKYSYLINNNYYVYYLDVSQGDAEIIRYKNKLIMIDTGGKVSFNKKISEDTISNNIITFIHSLGFNKIDYLIITHGDFDHMGYGETIVKNINVSNVVFNKYEINTLESNLIKLLNKKKIRYYHGLNELKILNTQIDFLNTKEYDNENDNSNVLYLSIYKYRFLFMGDAGIEREKDILSKYNIKYIDFFKVGHHGSDTSSFKPFIDTIKPKYSIISVGKNNLYHHPKESVLNTLSNSLIYRTDMDGTIEIKINRNTYKIKKYTP